MRPLRSPSHLVTAAVLLVSIACGTDSVTSPDQNFDVHLGCTTFTAPRGDLGECPLTVTATGGQSATIESVVLLANGQAMTDFEHSPGLSFYTDPTPQNLAGQTVDGTGLSVGLRAYADVTVTPGNYPAGLRVTYRLAGASSSTTITVPFDIVVT
jgi:hypothetical protein